MPAKKKMKRSKAYTPFDKKGQWKRPKSVRPSAGPGRTKPPNKPKVKRDFPKKSRLPKRKKRSSKVRTFEDNTTERLMPRKPGAVVKRKAKPYPGPRKRKKTKRPIRRVRRRVRSKRKSGPQ